MFMGRVAQRRRLDQQLKALHVTAPPGGLKRASWTQDEKIAALRWLPGDQLMKAVEELIPLGIDLIDRLPPDDVDTVLSVAVQQAAQNPDWPKHLTPLIGLVEALQLRGGIRDLATARSLLNCLGQALDQLHGLPVSEDARQAMALIEPRLRAALLTQVTASSGGADLWSAAKRVGDLHETKDEQGQSVAVDWTCQEDVLAVVRSLLRESGLTLRWAESMTLEAWALNASTDDTASSGQQQLEAVLHALVILDGMHLGAHHPSVDCLQRWLKSRVDAWDLIGLVRAASGLFQGRTDGEVVAREVAKLMEVALVGEAQKKAVLQLLQNPALTQADRSVLMECFAKVLSCPGTSFDSLEWIILNYAEHVDLIDVLSPIWEPTVPGDPHVSGIDRAVGIARRLATDPDRLHELRYHTQDMQAPTAKNWWFLVLFGSFYAGLEENPVPYAGADPGHDVRLCMSDNKVSFSQQRRVEFFCALWMPAVVNGMCHKRLDFEFLTHFKLRQVQAFWKREPRDPLLPLLRPSVRQSLSPLEQRRLLNSNVARMAVEAPHFSRVKGLIVAEPDQPDRWTDEDFEGGTQSVEACLQKECANLKSRPPRDDNELSLVEVGSTFYSDIGVFWAELAARRPQWLEAVSSQYPWLASAITAAKGPWASERIQNRSIALLIRRAAQERNAKELG